MDVIKTVLGEEDSSSVAGMAESIHVIVPHMHRIIGELTCREDGSVSELLPHVQNLPAIEALLNRLFDAAEAEGD